MKIIIKQLQGRECIVEASPNTSILELKQQVEKQLNIPVSSQRLLLIGRTLSDDQLVQTLPTIKDGTKLNLAVKKSDELYEISVKYFKKSGMSDIQAAKAACCFIQAVTVKFNKLSLDDLNRLCADTLEQIAFRKRRNISGDEKCNDS